MPWETIVNSLGIGGVTVIATVIIVVVLGIVQFLTTKGFEAELKRFESELKRAEQLQMSKLSLVTSFDTDLRARRITAYGPLWRTTGALPYWPRNSEITYHDLQILTADLCKWYYETGGMYLSTPARKAYGEAQDSLRLVLEEHQEGRVIDSDYDAIRNKCSALRTELTHDLLSRREAPAIDAH
jgi:hypothetical protein